MKETESSLATVMPYRPIESVYAISPFLVITFTAGMVTILVESYTLPVSQIWDLAASELLIINMINKILKMYGAPIFQSLLDSVCVLSGEFFQLKMMVYHLDQLQPSLEKVFYHGHIPRPPDGW